MDYFSGIIAVNDMLGLTDGELRKAVNGNVCEELQDVRSLESAFPEEGPVADVACLLRRHALVHPVRILGLPPPHREISLGRRPQIFDGDRHCRVLLCSALYSSSSAVILAATRSTNTPAEPT